MNDESYKQICISVVGRIGVCKFVCVCVCVCVVCVYVCVCVSVFVQPIIRDRQRRDNARVYYEH